MKWRSIAAISLVATGFAPPAWADVGGDGFHATPHLGWKSGKHHVDVGFEHRYRLESWKAFTSDWDTFHAFRTRFGAQYRYGDAFRLVAQGQHTALLSLGADGSGPDALYRSNSSNGQRSTVTDIAVSQLFAEWAPAEGSFVRAGREFVRLGTAVGYDESEWKFLKRSRVAQRLLGTVGWTHGERAYDGVPRARTPQRSRAGGLRAGADHGCLRHRRCLPAQPRHPGWRDRLHLGARHLARGHRARCLLHRLR